MEQTADTLGLSVNTFRSHLEHLYKVRGPLAERTASPARPRPALGLTSRGSCSSGGGELGTAARRLRLGCHGSELLMSNEPDRSLAGGKTGPAISGPRRVLRPPGRTWRRRPYRVRGAALSTAIEISLPCTIGIAGRLKDRGARVRSLDSICSAQRPLAFASRHS